MTKSKETPTLEQQIQAKLDELNALKEKQRKAENQQKIIVGALVLKACETDAKACDFLLNLIDKASDRDKKKLADVVKRVKTQMEDNAYFDDIQEKAMNNYDDEVEPVAYDENLFDDKGIIKHNIF